MDSAWIWRQALKIIQSTVLDNIYYNYYNSKIEPLHLKRRGGNLLWSFFVYTPVAYLQHGFNRSSSVMVSKWQYSHSKMGAAALF